MDSVIVEQLARLTDEERAILHGQKVQQSARARGITPLELGDEAASKFRKMCEELNISVDDYIRTTEPRHVKVVQEILQRLYDRGEIYKAEYKGFYSARQEQFLQEKDKDKNASPSGETSRKFLVS